MTHPLIYEVECQLDPDVVADYDAWLPGHVRQVLACPGFHGATIDVPEPAPGESPRRRVRYRVESAAALEQYFENEATRLRAETAARFGARVRCERRSFRPREDVAAPGREPRRCLNCGTVVGGRHCPQCGQSAETHVLSLREVAGDVTHSLLHLDSRVWRSLRLLVRRPGELTREFIAGRHQQYIPPFRLYLAISVLWFALQALLPDGDAFEVSSVRSDPAAAAPAAAPDGECKVSLFGEGTSALEKSLSAACRQARADGGRRFAEHFASTAPKLMFVFLPLIAAVALLFYWRPRRLYAEHLVLFLHNHAFTFLLLGATSLLMAIADAGFPLSGVFGFAAFLLWCYLPWYVYRSMRAVYGDGRLLTFAKFAAISLLYLALLGITMLAGLVIAALSLS